MLILHGENVPLLAPHPHRHRSSILQQQNQVGDGGGEKGGDQAAINLHGKLGQIYRLFFLLFHPQVSDYIVNHNKKILSVRISKESGNQSFLGGNALDVIGKESVTRPYPHIAFQLWWRSLPSCDGFNYCFFDFHTNFTFHWTLHS